MTLSKRLVHSDRLSFVIIQLNRLVYFRFTGNFLSLSSQKSAIGKYTVNDLVFYQTFYIQIKSF